MDFDSYLKENGIPRAYRVGDHLFRQGDDNGALYFIKSGLMKASYTTDEGKEQIKSFLQTGDIIGNLSAAYAREPNSFSLVCLEGCDVVQFSFEDMIRLSKENLAIAGRMNELLLMLAMKKERREYEFLCLSAEERYRLLLERAPDLPARVTQQDIALYLGITPVALSRIKKRLQKNL